MADKDRIDGKIKEMKGDVKETAGDMLGDRRLQGEGRADKVEGRLQQAKGHIKDAVRKVTK